ncbi:MAG: sugar ABC transporter permease [Paracoccaceae bacterium]|nr:sugar ABC transporter permease [Paracoccaceae bacterium]
MARSTANLQTYRRRYAAAFLSPMVVALLLIVAWPLLRSTWFSFTDASLADLDAARWVGLSNYFSTISLSRGRTAYVGLLVDPVWWSAVWNTAVFAVSSVAIQTVLGVAVALVLNARFPLRGLVRAAVLIPWAIPTIVSAKMWDWMLNDQLGIVNDLALRLGLLAEKVAWTSDVDTAMLAVILVDSWKNTPFVALLALAALQMIPGDIYEAAKIDGVHPVKVFFRITLPLIRIPLMVAVLFRMLDALRSFDLQYILTPANPNTKTMSVLARENLFEFDKFAYGSAQATLLFLIIVVFTALYLTIFRVRLVNKPE